MGINRVGPENLRILMFFAGAIVYVWGCTALATAKGYSSAIVFTVVLGGLFPLVVLLVLQDKHKYYRERHE
jgi:type IV secretory pathway VirB6-like protein